MLPSVEAFGITELLGMIFEYATLPELLLWQRVNKTWQAVIQGSPHIQEQLFFKVKVCKDITEHKHSVWNPFLGLFSWSKHSIHASKCHLANNAFDGKKASCPTASWRQMFVTRPAVAQLIISVFEDVDKYPHRIAEVPVRCETGVTIGQLADKVKESINIHAGVLDVDIFVARTPNQGLPSQEDYISWMTSD